LTTYKKVLPAHFPYWKKCLPWLSLSSVHYKWYYFNAYKVSKYKVCNTITAHAQMYHHTQPRELTITELQKIGSRPLDYNFLNMDHKYLIWMSVPPLMMYNLATEIQKQILEKIPI
jgi:site-specific DNA-cytosine methylase